MLPFSTGHLSDRIDEGLANCVARKRDAQRHDGVASEGLNHQVARPSLGRDAIFVPRNLLVAAMVSTLNIGLMRTVNLREAKLGAHRARRPVMMVRQEVVDETHEQAPKH